MTPTERDPDLDIALDRLHRFEKDVYGNGRPGLRDDIKSILPLLDHLQRETPKNLELLHSRISDVRDKVSKIAADLGIDIQAMGKDILILKEWHSSLRDAYEGLDERIDDVQERPRRRMRDVVVPLVSALIGGAAVLLGAKIALG